MGSRIDDNYVQWPPPSWPFLGDITGRTGQAILKDVGQGRVLGLSYAIQSEQIFVRNKIRTLHFFQIDGWEYSIRNESQEYPVLSFAMLDGVTSAPMDKSVQNVRVLGKLVERRHRLADKTVRASAYMMKQVSEGVVPDVLRILTLYRLVTPAMKAGTVFQLCRDAEAVLYNASGQARH